MKGWQGVGVGGDRGNVEGIKEKDSINPSRTRLLDVRILDVKAYSISGIRAQTLYIFSCFHIVYHESFDCEPSEIRQCHVSMDRLPQMWRSDGDIHFCLRYCTLFTWISHIILTSRSAVLRRLSSSILTKWFSLSFVDDCRLMHVKIEQLQLQKTINKRLCTKVLLSKVYSSLWNN